MKFKQWVGAGIVGIIGLFPLNVSAQCACTHLVCELCVEVTLPVIDAGTEAAFKALGVSMDAMDLALDAGIQLETAAIKYYGQTVVGAVEGNAHAKSGAIFQSSKKESAIMQAYSDSKERINKADFVARQSLYAERNFGWDNVPFPAKLMLSSQNKKVLDKDGSPTEQLATLNFLLQKFRKDIPVYLNKIYKTESNVVDDSIDAQRVMMFLTGGGIHQSIITAGELEESLAVRRMLVVPPGAQRAPRPEDVSRTAQDGYWRTMSRVKAAADLLAFDLSIRTESITAEGRTSILHLLRGWSERTYKDRDGIGDLSHAEARELKQWIATDQALGNIIDILIAELGRYQATIESAKIGFYAERALDPDSGYTVLNSFIEGAVESEER